MSIYQQILTERVVVAGPAFQTSKATCGFQAGWDLLWRLMAFKQVTGNLYWDSVGSYRVKCCLGKGECWSLRTARGSRKNTPALRPGPGIRPGSGAQGILWPVTQLCVWMMQCEFYLPRLDPYYSQPTPAQLESRNAPNPLRGRLCQDDKTSLDRRDPALAQALCLIHLRLLALNNKSHLHLYLSSQWLWSWREPT